MESTYEKTILSERATKDSTIRIVESSPFSPEQLLTFDGLKYYPVDKNYVVKARLEKKTKQQIIQLKTSTDRLPDYQIYADVYFNLDKKEYRLTAYKSINLQNDSLYKNYLFIPFTDNNSTITTYGGGRYIDFEIPVSDTFTLDFNRAYNPYCAYNHRWSCVIPPRENALDIPINAGEKLYHQDNQ
jgi:uncharacterized protein (DUF1684 family)